MSIKHQKKVTSKSEKNRKFLPIEDWAEDITKRKPRRHVIQDILPAVKLIKKWQRLDLKRRQRILTVQGLTFPKIK